MILESKKVIFNKRSPVPNDERNILIGTYLVEGKPTWYRQLNGGQDEKKGKQYLLDEGVLTYDEGTHSYLAFSVSPNHFSHYFFNYGTRVLYIPFHQQKLVFIVISRNASCCLLATAGKQQGDLIIADTYLEPAIAWSQIKGVAYNSKIPPEVENYQFAFVYQDPFSRWCQTCNYFMGVNFQRLGTFYIPNEIKKPKFMTSRFARLWHFLALCEAEQKFARGAKDQHILSQLETISYCPYHISLVIPMAELTTFITKEIGMVPIKANVEKSWWFSPEKDISSTLRERVESLYSEDYDIPYLFKGKFYGSTV